MIDPILPTRGDDGPAVVRSPESALEESVGLCAAIELHVVGAETVFVNKPRPATLVGRGVLERLADQVKDLELDLIVFDTDLTPGQQRNLERETGCKVIDRTGLILEIFGARARTAEGRLQVELAHLQYQRSRLVRSWTHLERQRGGAGFLGGPGESQIELDRRMIDTKIIRLKKDLDNVRRTRTLHRKPRQATPFPVIALVGYTNAGKSTLFNQLSGADVFAEDLLFATLDPTMRSIKLPDGRPVIMSDTVGFIADLPTHLVAAFQATLEEVTEADIVLHVQDAAQPDRQAQAQDVLQILDSLGIDTENADRLVNVYNKVDLLSDEQKEQLALDATADGLSYVTLSALQARGLDDLAEVIAEKLAIGRETLEVSLPLSDGQGIAWLYQRGDVLSREDDDEGMCHMLVRLDPADAGRWRKKMAEEN